MEDKKNKITISIFYETLKGSNENMSISDCKETILLKEVLNFISGIFLNKSIQIFL